MTKPTKKTASPSASERRKRRTARTLTLESSQLSLLAPWSKLLQTAAAFVADERVEQLISSPNVSADQLVDLFADLHGKGSEDIRNFIRLLGQNRRLALLPDIAAQFEALRAQGAG